MLEILESFLLWKSCSVQYLCCIKWEWEFQMRILNSDKISIQDFSSKLRCNKFLSWIIYSGLDCIFISQVLSFQKPYLFERIYLAQIGMEKLMLCDPLRPPEPCQSKGEVLDPLITHCPWFLPYFSILCIHVEIRLNAHDSSQIFLSSDGFNLKDNETALD